MLDTDDHARRLCVYRCARGVRGASARRRIFRLPDADTVFYYGHLMILKAQVSNGHHDRSLLTEGAGVSLLSLGFDEKDAGRADDMFVPEPSLVWRLYRRLVRTDVQLFALPDTLPNADILKLYGLSAPIPNGSNKCCPTIVVDLQQPADALWNDVEHKTRKVIRQAVREGITVVKDSSKPCWDGFRAAYEKLRGRKKNVAVLGVGLISDLAAKNHFVLTASRTPNGTILSWHGYARCHDQVCLINTVSAIDPMNDAHQNNLVGRAHRLHHWQDMLRFREEGIKFYDLGGVYHGTDDQEQANIARFKRSFGGEAVDRFDAVLPLTGKGRFAMLFAKTAIRP